VNSKWYERTEFWIALLGMIGGWVLALTSIVPAQYAAYLTVASAVAYAISRGLAKYNLDFKHGYRTSEFWLAAIGVAIIVAQAVPGHISAQVATVLSALVAVFYQVSRGMAKLEPEEPGYPIFR